MAFLLPQVQRALHFTAKVQLMRNRLSGSSHSSENPGRQRKAPKNLNVNVCTEAFSSPLYGATELSQWQEKQGPLRGGVGARALGGGF
jgi:hypothetical protein